MKTFGVTAIAFALFATSAAYTRSLLDNCSNLAWPECPGSGSTGQCPGGGTCIWTLEFAKDINISLCSCYTPGCGSGPCNRQVTWRVKLYKWKCTPPGELNPCIEHETSYCAEWPPQQLGTPNKNCSGQPCTGPCNDLVVPPPADPPQP